MFTLVLTKSRTKLVRDCFYRSNLSGLLKDNRLTFKAVWQVESALTKIADYIKSRPDRKDVAQHCFDLIVSAYEPAVVESQKRMRANDNYKFNPLAAQRSYRPDRPGTKAKYLGQNAHISNRERFAN
jgi:hypothetical protein